ncbi:hypothetical protein EYF80_011774 [Liparis tanakae]|uniref:Uncharacterized protein n=1 Tax=Liparis tanakae TaxID=230148 RepID=A0A4Z2IJ27_9TELE|nr:hypothetical protein EYF80_011774 [Liparis tanakae]
MTLFQQKALISRNQAAEGGRNVQCTSTLHPDGSGNQSGLDWGDHNALEICPSGARRITERPRSQALAPNRPHITISMPPGDSAKEPGG